MASQYMQLFDSTFSSSSTLGKGKHLYTNAHGLTKYYLIQATGMILIPIMGDILWMIKVMRMVCMKTVKLMLRLWIELKDS